jgi:hypothetical protein
MTVHGAPPSVDVSYRFPVWHLPDGKGLSFVVGPTSKDVAILRTGPDRPPAPTTAEEVMALARVDGPINPEGSPVTIRLLRHEWSLHQVRRIAPVDPKKKVDGEKLPDAVFVRLKVGDQEAADWLPFGLDGRNRVPLQVGGETWFVSYRSKSLMLPFDVHLRDFKIEWAPGQENQRPLAFESEVTVKDPRPGVSIPQFDYRIYMNHTLVHGGFTFFQSSYIRQPGQPDITILQVTKDPGEYVFYFGAIVMTLGTLAIFYMKPWLRRIELRQRGQAPAGEGDAPDDPPPPPPPAGLAGGEAAPAPAASVAEAAPAAEAASASTAVTEGDAPPASSESDQTGPGNTSLPKVS